MRTFWSIQIIFPSLNFPAISHQVQSWVERTLCTECSAQKSQNLFPFTGNFLKQSSKSSPKLLLFIEPSSFKFNLHKIAAWQKKSLKFLFDPANRESFEENCKKSKKEECGKTVGKAAKLIIFFSFLAISFNCSQFLQRNDQGSKTHKVWNFTEIF